MFGRQGFREGDEGAAPRDRRGYDRGWRWRDRRYVAAPLVDVRSISATAGGPGVARASARSRPLLRRPAAPPSRLRGQRLWLDPESPARRQSEAWRESRPRDAGLLERLASRPTAVWLRERTRDVEAVVRDVVVRAAAEDALPVLVASAIPNRDCGRDPAEDTGEAYAYRAWIRSAARGIDGGRAAVILEPDALAMVSCLTPQGRHERFSLLREAVGVLRHAGAAVYLAAGHPEWVPEDEMAQRLHLAGVGAAAGFALNVGSFVPTRPNLVYGLELSRLLGGAHFVIDTSRNGGSVAPGEWCNPRGAAPGPEPTTETGSPLLDALLWIKRPGESDGPCNGGPPAGTWSSERALALARAAEAAAP